MEGRGGGGVQSVAFVDDVQADEDVYDYENGVLDGEHSL